MDLSQIKPPQVRGSGRDNRGQLAERGADSVIEDGARIIHPENVRIGAQVFIGHDCYFDAYHSGQIAIGDGTWIGQMCLLHGAGGIQIGRAVGIGPRVTILTSQHEMENRQRPILHHPLLFAPVHIEDGADIGVATIILPGITIGAGAVVGAGSVVTDDVEPYAVVAGNPAHLLRKR